MASEHTHEPGVFAPRCPVCINDAADEAARRGLGVEAALSELETRPGAFGPVNVCCGVSVSVGHDLHCDQSASALVVTGPGDSGRVTAEEVQADLVAADAEYSRMRGVAEGFGIGQVVPEAFTARVEQQFRAEVGRREAEARAVLTERVRAALQEAAGAPMLWEYLDDEETHAKVEGLADAAVDVFVEWLRNPPGRPESGPWATWGGDGVGQ